MSAEHTDAPRAVIVISSHVVRGSVGNRAAVFALETLGFPVWAVPTVILPWHPGHGRATRIVPPLDQFKAMMADLERAPWLGEVARPRRSPRWFPRSRPGRRTPSTSATR